MSKGLINLDDFPLDGLGGITCDSMDVFVNGTGAEEAIEKMKAEKEAKAKVPEATTEDEKEKDKGNE